MIKIITVVGARPQFIKAAVVSRAFKKHDDVKEIIIHTGQHFDAYMSDVFFREMGIPTPDYYLNINNLNHGAMTGMMMGQIEEVCLKENPDFVLVYGDTNSTLAGALAAKKLHFRIAHVEAGLRSNNMHMPEEINRILTDRISDLLFCPTDHAVQNLRKEGFEHFGVEIINVGDVMYDAALFYAEAATSHSQGLEGLPPKFVLCTVHRAENTNNVENLKNIIKGVNMLAKDIDVVLPLHPRTKAIVDKLGFKINAHVIDPVGYLDMIRLILKSSVILTDSGGLQKEAYFFERPCLTMRSETEWVELLNSKANLLVGSDPDKIYTAYTQITTQKLNFSKKIYGNGDAGSLIAESIVKSC